MKKLNANLLFIPLTIALTLLSLQAQFSFWTKLFGVIIGYTASSVFEILRLTSLYALVFKKHRTRHIGVLIYVGVALFCGSIAITSWHGEIIESSKTVNVERDKQFIQKISEIKIAYAKKIDREINKLQRRIEYEIDPEIALAVSQDNKEKTIAWKERKRQVTKEINNLVEEKNEVLSANPGNKIRWLSKYSAEVGVNIHLEEIKETEFSALEEAIYTMWGLGPDQAKRMVSIIFVLAIEIGIILLAVLTEKKEKKIRKYKKRKPKKKKVVEREEKEVKKPVVKKIKKKETFTDYLKKTFSEKDIRLFVEKCYIKYKKTESLPQAKELEGSSKRVRKYLIDNDLYRVSVIKKLFKHYLGKE